MISNATRTRQPGVHGEDGSGNDEELALVSEHLAFGYRGSGEIILSDLNLSIEDGEFVAVLGGSGSGKSTLLRLIGGLLLPSSGQIYLDGDEIRKPTIQAGFVFQTPRLLPWKSVIENVLVPTRTFGKVTHVERARALDLLGSVGLDKAAHFYPNQLSGGMAQRVALARMLMHDPRLLLMDEPFSALDALTREMLSGELQSLWLRQRKTVMFVTHSISEAVFLADRVIVLGGKPATIIESIDVPLQRPRTLHAMVSEEFNEISLRLRELLASHFVAMPGLS